MSNTKRPNLQRQHTRTTEKARKEALEQGVCITVDGKKYPVRAGDLTSLDTMELRRETGFSFRSLLVSLRNDPDVDLIAALVWLSRRTHGEPLLTFAEVAEEIGYDIDVDVDEVQEDDSPEA